MSNEDVFDFDEIDPVGAARQAREISRVAVEGAVSKAIAQANVQVRSVADATRAVLKQLPAVGVVLTSTDEGVNATIDGVPRDLNAIVVDVLQHSVDLFADEAPKSGIIRSLASFETTAQKVKFVNDHGLEALRQLPAKEPPVIQQIVAKEDLRTTAEKTAYIERYGADKWLSLPLRRRKVA